MASNVRPASRLRGGAQRVKVHDENLIKAKQPVAGATTGGAKRIPVPIKAPTNRAALGEITTRVNQNKNIPSTSSSKPGDNIAKIKRGRSASVTIPSGPQRIPLHPNRASLQTEKQRISVSGKPTVKVPDVTAQILSDDDDEVIEIPPPSDAMDIADSATDDEQPDEELVTALVNVAEEYTKDPSASAEIEEILWPEFPLAREQEYAARVDKIRRTFKEEVDPYDTTMVSEYSEDIFEYMGQLESESMPAKNFINTQTEITWEMREKLVDWMCQAHLRYHMLPETLWIAVNIVDRFLSLRAVSLVKLQLVGVTALFIAAKYEEILAPAVDEFVLITDQSFSRDEILKGERIILTTLQFRISNYCSPYTWVRRISKADDYDLSTRTLSKFLMEMTLLDHRFLNAKPSMIAAIGMYSSRKILGGDWNEAFVFYSGFVEEHLLPGHNLLVEKLADDRFIQQNVCRKYAHKKFLKASLFAIEWAKHLFEDDIRDDATESLGPASRGPA